MESNDAAAQLKDLDRLRSTTATEAARQKRAAWPLMLMAIVAFFSSMAVVRSDAGRIALSVAWAAFVAVWVWWSIRAGKRAQLGVSLVPRYGRRFTLEWIAVIVLVNVIADALHHISWALVGVLEAATIGGWAALLARRGRHA